MSTPAIHIESLEKTYRIGFWRKRVRAVKDISFDVEPGEIFGLVGPNGAGKTTTIKALVGLIRPDSGQVEVFGERAGSHRARSNIGFLPENPYFYDHLTAEELLYHYGALVGVKRSELREQSRELLEMVGLSDAGDKRISQFSKGMRQRAGIAQALLGDPKLVILDEPQSGLDPIGRREVREIILSLKEEGKTVFFSSHILPDVETVCDRVVMLHKGRSIDVVSVDGLSEPNEQRVSVRVSLNEPDVLERVPGIVESRQHGSTHHIILGNHESANAALSTLVQSGADILAVEPYAQSLEDILIADIEA